MNKFKGSWAHWSHFTTQRFLKISILKKLKWKWVTSFFLWSKIWIKCSQKIKGFSLSKGQNQWFRNQQKSWLLSSPHSETSLWFKITWALKIARRISDQSLSLMAFKKVMTHVTECIQEIKWHFWGNLEVAKGNTKKQKSQPINLKLNLKPKEAHATLQETKTTTHRD